MDEPNLVISGLSRDHSHHDGRVRIEIYRLEDEHEWTLEVVDKEGTSTVWDDTFSSDEAALEEVLRCLREEGPQAFSGGNVIPFRR